MKTVLILQSCSTCVCFTLLWSVCGSRSSSNEGRTHTNTNEHTKISVAQHHKALTQGPQSGLCTDYTHSHMRVCSAMGGAQCVCVFGVKWAEAKLLVAPRHALCQRYQGKPGRRRHNGAPVPVSPRAFVRGPRSVLQPANDEANTAICVQGPFLSGHK